MEDCYYKELGVEENATDSQIRKAYKKLAKEWHPDKNNSKDAEERFKKINEAYGVLSDPVKKKNYDTYGTAEPPMPSSPFGGQTFGSHGFGSFGPGTHSFHMPGQRIDMNDIFDMFGQDSGFNNSFFRQAFSQGMPFSQPKVKDKSVIVNVKCTLEDFYFGKVKKMEIKKKDHTGRTVSQRPASLSKIVELNILPGYKAGTKITFKEEGDIKPNTIPADIIFKLEESKHSVFTRKRNDLLQTINISNIEAKNGFSRAIKFIDGSSQVINFKPIDKKDYVHIVRNKGMPTRVNGNQVGFGNLNIHFTINF